MAIKVIDKGCGGQKIEAVADYHPKIELEAPTRKGIRA